jgi:hypothetical protein
MVGTVFLLSPRRQPSHLSALLIVLSREEALAKIYHAYSSASRVYPEPHPKQGTLDLSGGPIAAFYLNLE